MKRVPIVSRPLWLSEWLTTGLDEKCALERFTGLDTAKDLVGRWRGHSLPTQHPLDGLLEALGWHGKWIDSVNEVHPLIFRNRFGRLIPIEPLFMPAALAIQWPDLAKSWIARSGLALAASLLRAHSYGARLETRNYDGRSGMALVYRRKSIVDHLRQVGPNEVIGLMEHRRMERPFFFLLTRDDAVC
jgi:hypothetical protein